MGLGLHLRAAFPGGPPDDPLGAVAAALAARFPGTVAASARDGDGVPALSIPLHPAAEDLEIALAEDGALVVSAKTSTAGPGYHAFVVELLDGLAAALELRWGPCEDGGDETGFFEERDPDELDRQMLAWLQALAEHLAAGDDTGLDVCLSIGAGFELPADTRTPLGPRDRAWWRAVAADPRRGIDFFAWWEPGQGAGYWHGLALALMWSEVRWRPPLDDAERTTLRRAADALARAHALDPARPCPWREWAELLALLGDSGDLAAEVRRAAARATAAAPIGYRRGRVRVALTGRWSMALPGALRPEWDEEGTLCATDGERTVWFSSIGVSSRSGEDRVWTLEQLRENAPEDAIETLAREEDGLVAVAALRLDGEGEGSWLLSTQTAAAGNLALATFVLRDRDDRAWAVEAWRSLARAADRGGEG